MTKESPWFKFKVSAWLLGRITGEKDAVKGIFIDACSHYWHKECDVSEAEMIKKLNKKRFDLLIKLEYIEVHDHQISIPFLDEQKEVLNGLSSKRSEAGRKGRQTQLGQTPGKRRANDRANDRAKTGNIDRDIDRDIDVDRDIDERQNEKQAFQFRINDQLFAMPVSEYFKTNFSIFFENWRMKNGDAKAKQVLDGMDTEYLAYTFNDINHIQRTFISIAKRIDSGKNVGASSEPPVKSSLKFSPDGK